MYCETGLGVPAASPLCVFQRCLESSVLYHIGSYGVETVVPGVFTHGCSMLLRFEAPSWLALFALHMRRRLSTSVIYVAAVVTPISARPTKTNGNYECTTAVEQCSKIGAYIIRQVQQFRVNQSPLEPHPMFWGLKYLEIVWGDCRGRRLRLFSLLGETLFWQQLCRHWSSGSVQRLGHSQEERRSRSAVRSASMCLYLYPSFAARVAVSVDR